MESSHLIDEKVYKSILKQLQLMDEEHLTKIKNNEFLNSKISKLKKIHLDILSDQIISSEIFEELKKLAISEGGFLTNEFRKDIWRKILCVEGKTSGDHITNVYISEESSSDSSIFYSDEICDYCKKKYFIFQLQKMLSNQLLK
jgi:hypothetical protein